jgi:hypothetical protein
MLRKRAGGLADIVGEPCRIWSIFQSLEPRLGRVVDPLSRQIRELRMAEENLIRCPRTPTDIFFEKAKVMSQCQLSFLGFLGGNSAIRNEVHVTGEAGSLLTCPVELPSHRIYSHIFGYHTRRRGSFEHMQGQVPAL